MLAGLDRAGQEIGAHLRGAGVEEHGVVPIAERGVEVGGVPCDAELPRDRRDLVGIAPDQDRIGHDPVAVRQRDAALLADRQDRADEVLVEAHAPGDAVHDDAERLGCHVVPPALAARKQAARRRQARRDVRGGGTCRRVGETKVRPDRDSGLWRSRSAGGNLSNRDRPAGRRTAPPTAYWYRGFVARDGLGLWRPGGHFVNTDREQNVSMPEFARPRPSRAVENPAMTSDLKLRI